MALTITHAQVAGTGVDADAIVDGADWDANHSISGSIAASEVTSPAALTKTDDTNVTLTLGGAPTTALLTATSVTVGWTGTLAAARLNSNVVQAITNDTNVTGSIAAQNLTLGWTGSLAVARGGTGATTHTAHGVLLGQGTSAVTTLNGTVPNSSLPLISQGASLDPIYSQIGFTAISGWGTGVTTALAVNVGSAGAFVTFNGALGTPSSGTLTNATGLPVSTGISGLGSNVAAFLATPSSANLASALTDETGSGANVFATSPTITNPNIVGTSTNDSAAAGSVGELIGSTVTSGSAVSLTTATPANITSISLTAGDWDVFGAITYGYTGTTNVTLQLSSISSTSATLDNTPGNYFVGRYGSAGLVPQAEMGGFTIGPVRKSLSGTTTIYLVGRSDFTVSTANGYGRLWARRVR